MKSLICCSKSKPYLYVNCCVLPTEFDRYILSKEQYYSAFGEPLDKLNGKIVGECDFEVEKIEFKHIHERDDLGRLHNEWWWEYRGMNIGNEDCELAKHSCMNSDAIMDYLNKDGYAIHIKNLKIYDESKELNEVYSIHDVGGMLLTDKLKKVPSNMQYISLKEWEYGTFNSNDIVNLITIQPECLYVIFTGKASIIIRKKVLKGMLWNI